MQIDILMLYDILLTCMAIVKKMYIISTLVNYFTRGINDKHVKRFKLLNIDDLFSLFQAYGIKRKL